ncbi:regulatory protein RecX [Leadbetterella sp. DM7]|uniref:regulatory protein RecX n=1 Tax=Leadbetterella sp. DM7 TaxID=3235085 RepID=UPI00349EF873
MSTLKKACSFCIYQERTQEEVREKLKSWHIPASEAEEIIAWLISENFINEGRYAQQFAGGKFRVKKWGRRKIIFALRSKGLSDRCIEEALAAIDEDEYRETLLALARRRKELLAAEESPLLTRKKITEYLVGKGYETDYIREALQAL